jgi:hypothetical protein
MRASPHQLERDPLVEVAVIPVGENTVPIPPSPITRSIR